MTIKIQELESLQDLTEVELEKVVGGQGPIPAEQQPTFGGLGQVLDQIPPEAERVLFGILDERNAFLRLFL